MLTDFYENILNSPTSVEHDRSSFQLAMLTLKQAIEKHDVKDLIVRMNTPESADRYKQRQHFGEMPFAVIKACFDMRRFLLRGLAGVQAEWQWCCTAFNLKKLMNLQAALRAEQCKMAKNEG